MAPISELRRRNPSTWRALARGVAMTCVLAGLLIACKPPAEVPCSDAARKLDDIVYAGETDARTLKSHERICAEEAWNAELRWCLSRARTRDDLAKCAPDTEATSPFLRGMIHEAK
jgi:hypothetical protein